MSTSSHHEYGAATRRRNPHRLYRNRQEARFAGVCAGIAEYFGFNLTAVRFLTLVAMVVFFPLAAIVYLILALVLPQKPVQPVQAQEQQEEAKFWKEVSNAPGEVFGTLRHRFRDLEHRLQRMEAYVTSTQYDFDRELGSHPRSGNHVN